MSNFNSSLLEERAKVQSANATFKQQEQEIADIKAELKQTYAAKIASEKRLENSDLAFKTKISVAGDASEVLPEELNGAKMRIEYLEDVADVQAGRIRDLQSTRVSNP